MVLIPRHQALGAAIASLASQVFYAIAQVLLSIRLLKIPANSDILFKLVLFLALNLIAAFLSLLLPGWIPGFLLLVTFSIGSAFLLGLIKPSEIRQILQE
jgi:O-antigen/teichoic acid export membrane protein